MPKTKLWSQPSSRNLQNSDGAGGRNVQFDEHWTSDNMDVVRAEAANLMANPDVVLATGGRVVPILMQLSSSIPIVLPGGSDPVRMGYARRWRGPAATSQDLRFSNCRCSASQSRY